MSEWREENFYKYANCIKTGCDDYEGVKRYYSTGSIKVDLIEAEGEYNYFEKPSRANRIALAGDVFQARMKATNKALLIDDTLYGCLFSTGFIQARPDSNKCLPKYIYHFVNSDCFLEQRDEYATGSTQEALTDTGLKKIIISIPPTIEEQHRIVECLEHRLGKLNTAREKLSKIPLILKRFRQSVLASACSGKLTEKWRENNKNEDNTILKEVYDYYKNSPQKDKQATEKFQKLAFVNIEIENSKWIKCNIGAIGKVSNGGTPSTKELTYWNGDIPWVSSGEVRNNIITETERKITEQGYNNSSVKKLKKGTVLIAMIGEGKTRGQTAILNIDSTINQNIAAVDLSHGLISSKYLWYWFQLCYQQNREAGNGSGPKALNCERVRELEFMLPPLHEQEEIVRRVDKLFAIADSIEQRYYIAKAKLDKAEKALYAKAFKGEL